MNYKMVIVIRTDLNMRKGKMCSQSAHAALNAYINWDTNLTLTLEEERRLSIIWRDWLANGAKKICVGVNSEAELLDVYNKALAAGLQATLVEDWGLSDLNGKNYTCVAIGPNDEEEVNKITGGLKLL